MPDFANISDANRDQRFIGVAQRLMHDLGLSADQARGVAWRLVHESDITPINERVPVVPGSRGGFGFAQWTGPRRVEFEKWAKDNGLSVNDPEANYRYLVHDMTANFPDALAELKKAKDWRGAYQTFTNQFEMSGGTPGKGTPVMAQSSLQKQLDDMFADAPKGDTSSPAVPSASAAPMDHKQALDDMFAPESQVAAKPEDSWPVAIVKGAAGVVHGINRGLSFGLHDRVQDLMSSFNPLAADTRKQQAGMYDEFRKEHPILNATAETAGAVPTYVLGEGALSRVLPVVEGGGLVRGAANVLSGAARNAAVSGVAGAGMADENPLAGGVEGALTGAVAYPAIAAGTSLAGKVLSPIAARLSGRYAQNRAIDDIAKSAMRDQMLPADLQSGLTALGPNGALVDLGPNLRNRAEVIANSPGPGAKRATEFLEGRAEGQQSRINDAIAEATGRPGGFHETVDELMTKRSADAAPLYEAALQPDFPVHSERIQQFLSDPIAKQGLKEGLEIQRLESLAEGKPFNPNEYAITSFNEAGDPVMGEVPNMRTLDAVKRGLDNILEGYRDGTTGRLNLDQRGRAIEQVRKAFVKELDSSGPVDENGVSLYAKARAAWAGPSQARDMMDLGRRVLSNDPEVTAKTVSNLSASDKEFFLNGVARAIKDKVAGTQDGADATRRIFGNTLIRDKLKAAFGNDAAFEKFTQAMENEATFARTRNEVLKNSVSARRLAGMADQSGLDLATPVVLAARGQPFKAAANIGQQGLARVMGEPAPAYNDALARYLFTPAGDPELMAALQRNRNPLLGPLVNRAGALEVNRLYGQP